MRDQTTQIEKVSKIDGRVIVQGVEAGRGWSLLLDPETGHTILTVSGDDVAFIVFGECTRP